MVVATTTKTINPTSSTTTMTINNTITTNSTTFTTYTTNSNTTTTNTIIDTAITITTTTTNHLLLITFCSKVIKISISSENILYFVLAISRSNFAQIQGSWTFLARATSLYKSLFCMLVSPLGSPLVCTFFYSTAVTPRDVARRRTT